MIKIGKRILSAENHWQPVNKIEEPSVIVFGGNTTDNEEKANGNAKLWQNIANIDPAKTNLYSMSYEKEIIGDNHNILRKDFLNELDKCYEQYFQPLLFKGKQLKSEASIAKTFSSITFVAHCAGVNVVDYIISRWYNDLSVFKSHNKISNVDNLIKKIQFVGFAPHVTLRNDVSALYIAPFADRENTWVQPLELLGGKKDREFPAEFMKTFGAKKLPGSFVQKTLKEYPMIVVQKGSTVVVVPGPISTNGDHSPEVLLGSKEMAIAVRESAGKTINMFIKNASKLRPGIDMRKVYDNFADRCESMIESGCDRTR